MGAAARHFALADLANASSMQASPVMTTPVLGFLMARALLSAWNFFTSALKNSASD
eukprot:CAMPEP_0177566810 /NCGR_PEP_ID=MMETSP0369-20130122/74891_1 /TAXON_ID=447022 ORGANISM="Scrippsiella hangoei-like, Strain SHHI-4" /NCGR_SAMPLE_ID=MMETSP0369 /ASSEMBLY_ACC=CAM_ASM_000364 /LENGTH=55 /DNA_ID=CAMNT_0019054277 /DNA_START=44 /DNA_END=208 /DNA_ORIENTATION=-